MTPKIDPQHAALSSGESHGKPRIVVLGCGAGGSSTGYHRAGWEVVGVDFLPQPNYPFEFIQADALTFLGDWNDQTPNEWFEACGTSVFAAIHASMPCQRWTAYKRRGEHVRHREDLVTPLRPLLEATGLPYVIENVPGAPLVSPVRLCGSSFGLDIRRHRLFETNWPLQGLACDHSWQTPRFPAATNRAAMSRRTIEIGVYRIPLERQKEAMQVDWSVTLHELSQMVPPAYTEHIGHQLAAYVELEAAA
jgi:DNA (cytosine-5)-methyltransferase 1